jgi:hypothetical protein
MDLTDLAVQLEAMADSLPAQVNEVKQEAAAAILFDLTQTTPVDVGKALSNWQVSLDEPNEAPIEAHVPSVKGRWIGNQWVHSVEPDVTRGLNAPPTYDVGEAIIKSAQPGESIFITDAVPYIQRLNEGYSDQAPAGFVERAIIIGRSIMDKFRVVL